MKAMPVIAMSLILLAGCTPQADNAPGTGNTAVGQPVSGYACPPAGTVVTFETGGSRTYQGSDPADPAICLSLNARGTVDRRIFDSFPVGTPSDRAIRVGMSQLYPLAIGRTADFITVQATARGDTNQYREVFSVTGEERIAVGGQQVDAWIIRRRQEGMGGNTFRGTETYWADKASGAWLKRTIDETFGNRSGARPYMATALQRSP